MRRLYHNGRIITLSPDRPEAGALLTDGEKIAAAGSYSELSRLAPDAQEVDLRGAALLPAFIDAHSHILACASAMDAADLSPARSARDVADIVREFIASRGVAPGNPVRARGYDEQLFTEKAHPTLADADDAAPDNPLAIEHISGHMGVFNSAASREYGVPAGYAEEGAFIAAARAFPMPSAGELLDAFVRAQDMYASHGVATAQEGLFVPEMLPLYSYFAAKGAIKLDIVAYAELERASEIAAGFPRDKNLRLGGYKLILDGSPQARTAWVSEPYIGGGNGVGERSGEEVLAAVRRSAADNMQLLAHCNGDAAAEQFIRAVETARGEGLNPPRPVMIHAQLLRRDQLRRVRDCGIIPSFFVRHVWRWGDAHVENLGLARAERISPAGSALREGIRFTFHQDSPVLPPDMLATIKTASERLTMSGRLLGADERISEYEAVRALTVNAAYQYGEEAEKGTLEKGKFADLVIIDEGKVRETVRHGETVFKLKDVGSF